MADQATKSAEEWKRTLSDEQYDVCWRKGTERAFTGTYWDNKEAGTYRCVCCGTELFSSDTKFDSGTGWPSFWAAVGQEKVATTEDWSHLMRRTEVHCRSCGAHLGHLFEDGPPPTGQRFCINSAALRFEKKTDPTTP